MRADPQPVPSMFRLHKIHQNQIHHLIVHETQAFSPTCGAQYTMARGFEHDLQGDAV